MEGFTSSVENPVVLEPMSPVVDPDGSEDGCSICLEPFSSHDPATITNCRHEYHLQCILEWSQRSKECPICWQLLVLKDPARLTLESMANRPHRGVRRAQEVDLDHTPAQDLLNFRSKQAEDEWSIYDRKKVDSGRFVDPSDFRRFKINQKFEALGWTMMLHLTQSCYPRLVKYFYCNLRLEHLPEDEVRITSRVKGRDISFTTGELAEIIHVSNEGERVYYDASIQPDRFLAPPERAHVFQTLTGGADRASKESDYTPTARVLSRIVQYNVVPKGGHRDQISLFGSYVTFCLYIGHQICLPYLIMCFMTSRANSPRGDNLPYGRLLTQIFSHFEVDFTGERHTGEQDKDIDISTLTRMGMRDMAGSDGEGEGRPWDMPVPPARPHRRTTAPEEGFPIPPSSQTEPGSSSTPPLGWQPDYTPILSSIAGLRSDIMGRFDGLSGEIMGRLDKIDNNITILDGRVRQIEQTLRSGTMMKMKRAKRARAAH